MNSQHPLPKGKSSRSVRRALLITDNPPVAGVLLEIQQRLASRFAFEVDVLTPSEAIAEHLLNYDLLLIATSNAPSDLRLLPKPIILLNPASLSRLGMGGQIRGHDYGFVQGLGQIDAVGGSLLSGGLIGPQAVVSESSVLCWGRPSPEALVGASVPGMDNVSPLTKRVVEWRL
jgi:hypothetical protein